MGIKDLSACGGLNDRHGYSHYYYILLVEMRYLKIFDHWYCEFENPNCHPTGKLHLYLPVKEYKKPYRSAGHLVIPMVEDDLSDIYIPLYELGISKHINIMKKYFW